ncbi:MAG: ParB/RepB/Spo0J family partition protein [Verrucomicrobia bacterium]|nr:ParB/RepB/Spo0J family partition protein [Verrucomicrobiota bacterium]
MNADAQPDIASTASSLQFVGAPSHKGQDHGTFADVSALNLHPLQAQIPAPDVKSEGWKAFLKSVKIFGVLQPLVVTPCGQVMDGGWRLRACRALKIHRAPVVIRPDHDAASIIKTTLFSRKTITRGAAAYIALRLTPDLIGGGAQRRLANLKNSPNRNDCVSTPQLKAVARGWGVSERLLSDAIRLHKIFTEREDLKKQWEAKLLTGELGLAQILAAIPKPAPSRPSKSPGRKTPIEKLCVIAKSFERAGKLWPELDRGQRAQAAQVWRRALTALPLDFASAILSDHKSTIVKRSSPDTTP